MFDLERDVDVFSAELESQSQAPFWADLAFKWSGAAAFLAGAAAAVKYLFA